MEIIEISESLFQRIERRKMFLDLLNFQMNYLSQEEHYEIGNIIYIWFKNYNKFELMKIMHYIQEKINKNTFGHENIAKLFDRSGKLKKGNKIYYGLLIWILVIGSLGIIIIFGNKLKQLVDLATTISFMIAPMVALANYKLVSYPFLNEDAIPPKWLRNLAIGG